MSPEASVNTPAQSSEIVPPAHEATAEAVDMAGDRAVESSVTKIPVAEDPLKSETVGRAAMERNPALFDGSKAEWYYKNKTNPDEEYLKTISYRGNRGGFSASEVAGWVAELEADLAAAEEAGDPQEIESVRSHLESVKESLTKVLAETAEDVKKNAEYQYEQHIPEVKAERSAQLEPFEEFYDLSPDVFSKMPTAEFVAAYKEFSEIESVLKYSSEGLENTATIIDKLKEMIVEKKRIAFIPPRSTFVGGPYRGGDLYSRQIISTVGVGLGAFDADKYDIDQVPKEDKKLDGLYDFDETFDGAKKYEGFDDFREVVDKYIEDIHKDEFNKSPHQILDDYIRVTTDYADQIKARFDEAERRKQEFMAKYAITTPHAGSEQSVESSEQNQPQAS